MKVALAVARILVGVLFIFSGLIKANDPLGLSYKMIGADLNISYETVRSHVKKIYEKLHVASLTEVVAKAIHQRIV